MQTFHNLTRSSAVEYPEINNQINTLKTFSTPDMLMNHVKTHALLSIYAQYDTN